MAASTGTLDRTVACVRRTIGDGDNPSFSGVGPATTFRSMGFDSLDYLALSHEIEQEFDVHTAGLHRRAAEVRTIAELAAVVESLPLRQEGNSCSRPPLP